jgi:hypothetical protein
MDEKTMEDRRALFAARLRRNAKEPGLFGIRQSKLNQRSILEFVRDVTRYHGLTKAEAVAECEKVIDLTTAAPIPAPSRPRVRPGTR